MERMNKLIVGAAAAGGVAVAGVIGSVIAARQVVLPVDPPQIPILHQDGETMTLAVDGKTIAPGILGIFRTDRTGHATLSRPIHTDSVTGAITRRIESIWGASFAGEKAVICEGDVFAGPEAVDPDYVEVLIPGPLGDCPAWQMGPDENPEGTWAIHVHGIRTKRIHALRSVPAMTALGYTSLVVSFRGDGDGPAVPRSASMLGQREWADVAAAIDYAAAHGARKIVLIGWSLGGGVALLAAERTSRRDLLSGLVLIGPALNWKTAIEQGAVEIGLPRQVAILGLVGLRSKLASRLVGLPEPVDFDALDWVREPRAAALGCPILLFHSPGDTTLPMDVSQRFATLNAPAVEVVETAATAHNTEYNVDPEVFDATIARWISQHQ